MSDYDAHDGPEAEVTRLAGPGWAPRRGPGPAFGTVVEFDGHRGLGTIVDGRHREWPFHCTAIADGSRTIEVGATVVFRAVAGHLGRMEAVDISPLPPPPPPPVSALPPLPPAPPPG